jgi:two-component system, chemotaxis family, chemotaxis protein CheY
MPDFDLQDLRVMVVDDEVFSRRFLTRVLEAIDVAKIIETSGANEALAKLAELGEGELDVIITDIDMPEVNGYEFSRKIRFGAVSTYKDIPIVILSGELDEENMRRARAHRVDAVVAKPPSVDVLRLQLQALLKRRRAGG